MEIRPEEITRISESPADLFMRSLTVPATRRNYISSMKKIMCEFLGSVLKGDPDLVKLQKAEYEKLGKKNQKSYFDADFEVRISEFVHRTKADPGWAESVLIKLTQEFAKNINDTRNPEFRGLGTVANYLKMIKKLLQQNRVALNWDNVYSYLPTEEIREDTRGYTRQEVQKMLNHCHNAMDQVIVLLGASSGIRAGAFVLKWKHLKPVYQFKNKYYFEDHDMTESIAKEGKLVCGMIRIYAQSNAEYFAFITPECWNMIQEYRQKWVQDIGKEPIEEDAFFKQSGFVVRSLTKDGIEKRLLRVARDSGLRPPLKKGQRIHEIPLFNGLRRFFNKENKKSLTKNSPLAALILKETMMGHGSLIKLDKNYFKEHADELIEEYLQAVPNLTISDALRKEAENVKLRKKNFELENEKHKVTNLEQDLKSVHIILDEIQKRLKNKT